MLEQAETIGGVWAKERLYPGLKSNNMLGTYEFSDFAMTESSFGVKPGEHIPGLALYKYLQHYAEKFDLHRLICVRTKVETVERQADGTWVITTVQESRTGRSSSDTAPNQSMILTQKLIIATGLTSEPFLPDFKGSASFDAPLFHCKSFPDQADVLFRSATSVVVLGGNKFAWDTVYACASAGIAVDWVIRKSGHGPGWMAPPYVTPLKKWLEKLVTTRFLTWFSPCTWGDSDGYGTIRRFFHGTRVGRWMVDCFWAVLANDVVRLNGYDRHLETKRLKPWTSPFWSASSLSILNYPTDFFEHVRNGRISVHIEDIISLSSKTVHLSSGQSLKTDALICSTGWKHRPAIRFLPEGSDPAFGLPYRSEAPEDVLIQKADAEIFRRFPRLRGQPVFNPNYQPLKGNEGTASPNRPYNLYRFMIPPALIDDRSIAYIGMMQTTVTSLAAQTQALWLTAYLDGTLPLSRKDSSQRDASRLPFHEEIQWDTALHSRFGKWRCPAGFGNRYPDFVFDAVPYLDQLLRDLGLEHRRKGGLLAEWFEPYGPADYRGLVDEWKIKVSRGHFLPCQQVSCTELMRYARASQKAAWWQLTDTWYDSCRRQMRLLRRLRHASPCYHPLQARGPWPPREPRCNRSSSIALAA